MISEPISTDELPSVYSPRPHPCPVVGPGMEGFSASAGLQAVIPEGELPTDGDCLVMQAQPVAALQGKAPSDGEAAMMIDPDGNSLQIEARAKARAEAIAPGVFARQSPDRVELISPSGSVQGNAPVFSWQPAEDTHWYYIWVRDGAPPNGQPRLGQWITAEQAGCADGQQACRWESSASLAPGSGSWWVLPLNNAGEGPWSQTKEFEITASASSPPPTPVKLAPEGAVDTNRPAFQWEAEPDADDYFILIRDSETMSGAAFIARWLTPAQANCASGSGLCSFTPGPNRQLANGAARWWVRASNDAGPGLWGSRMDFSVNQLEPNIVTKLAPQGEVETTTPTFEWEADPNADEYFILVRDSETLSGAARIAVWLTPWQADCVGGSGTCSWTANTDLVQGEARWWARASNDAGVSQWGGRMDFEVAAGPPPALTKLGPEGAVDTFTPTFEWEADPSADDYFILVRDSETMDGPARIAKWLRPWQADCIGGTGTCSWTADTDLAAGDVRWWVRAANDAGTSIWGGFMEFEISFPITGYEFIFRSGTLSGGGVANILIPCPAGKIPLSGGMQVPRAGGDPVSTQLEASIPIVGSGEVNQWLLRVSNLGKDELNMGYVAVCIDEPSGFEFIDIERTIQSASNSRFDSTCPADKYPIGGGFAVSSGPTTTNTRIEGSTIRKGVVNGENRAIGWNMFIANLENRPIETTQRTLCSNKPKGYEYNRDSDFTLPSLGYSRNNSVCSTNDKRIIAGGIRTRGTAWPDIRIGMSAPGNINSQPRLYVNAVFNFGTEEKSMVRSTICVD